MLESRRRLLLLGTAGIAAVAGSGMSGMAGCSGSPTQLTQQVIDALQSAVATACSWVPSVASLIALIAMFPALAGATAIASTLLTEVSGFLCTQFHNSGGVPAAVEAATSPSKTLKASLKDGATVELHGLVWDTTTKKFIAF